MSFESFKKKLVIEKGATEDSQEHTALLKHVQALVKDSRTHISSDFETWDYNDLIFRSKRKVDKEDRSAMLKGNTAKMIVPLTNSQIMTYISFNVMTLQQNRRFFELEPIGTKVNPLREPMELILDRDVRRNHWTTFLIQFFLDIARFGQGAAEIVYEETYRMMRLPISAPTVGPMGMPGVAQSMGYQKVPVFHGNKLCPVSPYRFFYDTRLPLTRYQEGEFCGSEDMFTMSSLRNDPNLFNVEIIPKMTQTELDDRKKISRIDDIPVRQNANLGGLGQISAEQSVRNGSVVLTKVVVDITHSQFKIGEETPLGKENFPVRYIVWYANDRTIVRFDEATYLHGQFPYIAAQYLPDQHRIANEGLADLCDQITEYITWLANTHKASQANSMESKWAVDPAGVDIKSLESRSPYIHLKKGAANMGVDRYLKQFITQDVTQNTPQEIGIWKTLLESVTGLSGFMQGQSSEGRRSATQDQVVTQGAAARGKTGLSSIWDSAFQPLGRQMITNNRQDMDFETFYAIVGDNPCGEMVNPATQMPYSPQELFAMFQSDPMDIARAEDFFVFDGTLPSEKAYMAQALEEFFMEMLQNPQIAAVMGYGPVQFRQLFQDIYTLRGVTNSRLPAPNAPIQQPQPGVPGGPPGLPPPGGTSDGLPPELAAALSGAPSSVSNG